jgi:SAM-dependent methyltransferase
VAHWFEAVADHLGPAYLRYSFTYGTEQEVSFLVDALGLSPGMRVLDVGCGPGRHALALARRGLDVVGIDISQTFIDLARDNETTARFERADARELSFSDEFDAVFSLCQGGFGLCGGGPGSPIDDDLRVLHGMARAAKAGGTVAVSAFSAYFRVRYLDETVDLDAERGAYHEVMELRDLAGTRAQADGWTTCFSPRELRLMFAATGLAVEGQWSVSPGDYARRPPDLDHYEYLTVGRRLAVSEPGRAV